MNKLIVFSILFIGIGCSHKPTLKERKIACVTNFIEKDVDALKGKSVCEWVFERN